MVTEAVTEVNFKKLCDENSMFFDFIGSSIVGNSRIVTIKNKGKGDLISYEITKDNFLKLKEQIEKVKAFFAEN